MTATTKKVQKLQTFGELWTNGHFEILSDAIWVAGIADKNNPAEGLSSQKIEFWQLIFPTVSHLLAANSLNTVCKVLYDHN